MDDEEIPKHRRHLRPNRGQNPNARWIVDDPPKKAPTPKKRKTAPKPTAEPILEGDTLCSCNGAVSDDRTMAECEKCKTWQHVVCEFGVEDESVLPEKYQCKRCRRAAGELESDSETTHGAADLEEGAVNGTNSPNGLAGIKDKVRRSVAEAWLKIVEPLSLKHAKSIDGDASVYAVQLAIDIEAALYAMHGDTHSKDPGHVYREQFRMLSFNLKDDKNERLQAEVVLRKIAPERFVGLTSAELRTPEMRKLANEIKQESLNETIIPEAEPPQEKITTSTAEVNMEPTFIALEKDEEEDSANEEEAMKEPLGPPPTEPAADEKKTADAPVWEGRIRLGAKLDFAASGLHLQAPDRARWPRYIENSESLNIDGAVPLERAITYLEETAANTDAHSLASLVLLGKDDLKLHELYEYFTSRDRVGAVEHSSPHVKDAYILPVKSDAVPAFLSLEEDAKMYLGHLKAEHNADNLLLLVLVLFK